MILTTRRTALAALTLSPWLSEVRAAKSPVNARQLTELAPDIRRIVERGALVIGMYGVDIVPFYYMKDGRLQGSDVEMAQSLANELEVVLIVDRSAGSFNEVIDLVASSRVDMGVSELSRTFKRALRVHFSEPYVSWRHAMALNRTKFAALAKEHDPRLLIKTFAGSVGVLAGSSFVEFARRSFPKARVVEFKHWQEAIDAARKGVVDAVYYDELEIRYLMKSDPSNPLFLRAVFFNDLIDTIAIALPHSSRQLSSFVNLFLSGRRVPQTVESLLQQRLKP
jgi:polar amino acid transport system substrate-binding protein